MEIGTITKSAKYDQANNSDLFTGGRLVNFLELVISKKKPVQQALEQKALPKMKGKATLATKSCIRAPVTIPDDTSKKTCGN